MTLNELIAQAANEAGSLRELAREMGKHQNRLCEWKNGTAKPDANEIAYMADRAGKPVLKTVAEIAENTDDRYASIWRNALKKLTAAGVAATVGAVMVMTPQNANASPSQVGVKSVSLYIMSTRRKALKWVISRMRRFVPMHSPC